MRFENDLLYLSLCALTAETPAPERLAKINIENLLKFSRFHKLTALVCYALEKASVTDSQFKEEKGKSIRKNMLLDSERSKIFAFMEEKGIKHMPLKGIIIKEFYPMPGMRQMSDNDIYFDGVFSQDVEQFMAQLGYNIVEHGLHHDEYKRLPVYNFEMHHKLFSHGDSHIFSEYYKNIDQMLIKDSRSRYGYHMSDEDFYIYFVAHEYKHFAHGGTGLRSLLDCIVLLKKLGDCLDWDYIDSQTSLLSIDEFEQEQRILCKKLMKSGENADLTQKEAKFLSELLEVGAYGTTQKANENRIKSELRGGKDSKEKITLGSKLRYAIKRIYPPLEFYKTGYPFFYRHRWLIPISPLYRLAKSLVYHRRVLKTELGTLKDKE